MMFRNSRKRARPFLVIASLASLTATALAQTTQPADYLPYGQVIVPEAPQEYFIKPRTVQLIDEALKRETDSALRVRLSADLGRAPMPDSIPVLNRLLTDADPLVRAAAVQSLIAIQAADAASLSPLIKDASSMVRREVVLSKLEPAILAGIADAAPSVRSTALSVSVSEATDRAIADELPKLDPPLQAIAARTLAARGAGASASAIGKLLDSPSVVSRVVALESLATLKAVTTQQVQAQIKHAHPAIRVAAIKAASALPDAPDRASAAATGIADADLAVRVPAATLLGSLGDPTSAPVLAQQLASGYEPLRVAARAALVRLVQANPASRAPVEAVSGELLTNPDAQRRIDGSIVLGLIKSTHAMPAHLALLNDTDWTVVRQAAISLGLIEDPAAIAPIMTSLSRALADPMPADRDVAMARIYAAERLILGAVALRHKPVLDVTKKFPLDKKCPSEIRLASIFAVGLLASPEEANTSLRALLGRTRDLEESAAAISEGVKALGNARAKAALPGLKKMIESDGGEYAYIAHIAIDRINGTTTPFVQQPNRFEADTAIQAVDPN